MFKKLKKEWSSMYPSDKLEHIILLTVATSTVVFCLLWLVSSLTPVFL